MIAAPDAARLTALLTAGDPLAAARAAGVGTGATVRWRRGAPPAGTVADGDVEGPLTRHRRAHAAGTPTEAALAYGHGVAPARVAERLAALAALSRETGLLAAVQPVPAEGGPERPGSWGVEDLTVIAVARLALPGVAVSPHWRRLGPAACQIAVAFGADLWTIPDDDPADPEHLAAAVGAVAEPW